MKGQFFIMATVIMIYTLMTMTHYIYDFSNINLVQLKKMPQLFYMKDIKDALNKTVTSSSQSLDCNKLETDIDATENFLKDEMISRGIVLTINHNIDCSSLTASFDIGLKTNEFYVSSGNPIIVQQPFDGVLWLKFNEALGTEAFDSSPYGNNGTLYGETFSDGTSYSGSSPTDLHTSNGYYRNALSFDGVNDYLNLTNSSKLNTTSFTVMFWLNLASDPECNTTTNNWRSLMRKSSFTSSATNGWDIVLEQSGTLTFDVGNGTTSSRLNSGGTISVGDWTHLAFTYDSSTNNQIIYMNGLPVASKVVIGSMQTNTNPVLFSKGNKAVGCPDQDGYFNGTVDEIRIWNVSLTSSEINDEMQSSMPTTRPTASYSFEEGSGNYVNDTNIWVNGTYGSALSFDGINDLVNVSDSPSLDVSNLTITAWIYPKSLGGADKGRIVDKVGAYEFYVYNDSTAPQYSYSLTLYSFTSSGTDQSWSTAYSVKLNKWQHVAVTYDGQRVRFYIDGILNNTHLLDAPGPLQNSNINLYIGYNSTRYDSNTRAFNGTIDEVRIWNRSLSQEEILNDMNRH